MLKVIDFAKTDIFITTAKCSSCGWQGEGRDLQYNQDSHIDNLYDLCPQCGSDNTQIGSRKISFEEYQQNYEKTND